MGNLMNSYFYGKAGKADYTPDQLPSNRVQLFFEMLRVRISGMFGLNLLYVLFCIPAIVWSYINYLMVSQSVNQETGEVIIDFIGGGYLTVYLLLLIPCMGLCGVGATGLMYVLRNWARDQHSFVWSDFKDAVKGNWKCGLLVGLLNGLSLLLAYVCYTYYGQMAVTSSMFFYVPQMLVLLFIAVWWMINMLIYPMMVTYDMKFTQLVRNCAIIAVARLPFSVLFLVGSVGVPFVLANVPYGVLILVVLYLFLGFALTGFVYASYANSCFDKYLNLRIKGASVNMGLRDPSLDDEDDDVEDPNPLA